MNGIRRELFRFIVVGVGSNVLNFVVYVLAHLAGASLFVASTGGYLTGVLNSYYFGKNWVFGKPHAHISADWMSMARFFLVYATGGLGMSGIIEVLDRGAGMDYRASWVFGATFAFTNNFLGSKWLVFKGSQARHGN